MNKPRTGKPKLLFIEEVSGMGGSNTCLSSLVTSLIENGYACEVLLYFNKAEVERLFFHGVKKYHVDKKFAKFISTYLVNYNTLPKIVKFTKLLVWFFIFFIEAVRRIAITYWIIMRSRANIVHTNNSISLNMFSIIAAKIANVPCVCHIRGFEVVPRRLIPCLNSADAVITMSDSVRSVLCESSYVQRSRVISKMLTIYDGLSEAELAYDYSAGNGLRQQFAIDNTKTLIGMVGMLTEWKGFHLFLSAAGEILRTRNDVVFFVIGDVITQEDTAYKGSLFAQVVELGIEENVIFTGLLMDTQRAFGSLDIVVHASIYPEAFGRVIIEAMAASKPVIAVNAGGPAEIIQHGVTGLLYISGDVRELVQNIVLLLNTSNLRKQIGVAARKHVEENFRMDITVRETIKVYSDIVDKVAR